MAQEEVLFEMRRVGGSVKVSAIHAPTMTEISVVCPATASEQQMKSVALQKLRYVLNKKAQGSQ
jgi:hypothetical protein